MNSNQVINESNQIPAIWWYAVNGEQRGPCTENEIANLINSKFILAKTKLWCVGMPNWVDADYSYFRNLFYLSPPPVILTNISDGSAWALATIPILASFILNLFIDKPYSAVFFLIPAVLGLIIWAIDISKFEKVPDAWNWLWTGLILIPVYLFFRASKTNNKYGYAITWCVLFFVSFLINMINAFI